MAYYQRIKAEFRRVQTFAVGWLVTCLLLAGGMSYLMPDLLYLDRSLGSVGRDLSHYLTSLERFSLQLQSRIREPCPVQGRQRFPGKAFRCSDGVVPGRIFKQADMARGDGKTGAVRGPIRFMFHWFAAFNLLPQPALPGQGSVVTTVLAIGKGSTRFAGTAHDFLSGRYVMPLRVSLLILLSAGGGLLSLVLFLLRYLSTPDPHREIAGEALYDWNLKQDVLLWTRELAVTFGYPVSPSEPPLRWWAARIHPEDSSRVVAAKLRSVQQAEPFCSVYRFRKEDGCYCYVQDQGRVLQDMDGYPVCMIGNMRELRLHGEAGGLLPDVLDRLGARLRAMVRRTFPRRRDFRQGKQVPGPQPSAIVPSRTLREPGDSGASSRLQYELAPLIFRDRLTGLPNRALFRIWLHEALERTVVGQSSAALICLDLDRFQLLNDSLGAEAGEELLVRIAERLREERCFGDRVARLGEDEFAVLLDRANDAGGVMEVVDRLRTLLAPPLLLAGREFYVTSSFGIVASIAEYRNVDDLLSDATEAIDRARARGRAQHEIVEERTDTWAADRLELELDFRQAFEQRQFEVYYQPLIYSQETVQRQRRRILGVEALVRWRHPSRGLLSPAAFIPVAEESGLIHQLGHMVLAEACRQARRWQHYVTDQKCLEISVNLSAFQLQRPTLVEEVEHVLMESALDPACLKLEITESMMVSDVETTIRVLQKLKALGVQLVIDDFGTGYASFNYLKQFPLDVLKIDRSFVQGLGKNLGDRAIVLAMVTLARSLGLQVTAEGVENDRQLAMLGELGCDVSQGFYFSKPLPVWSMQALLEKEFGNA